MDLDGKVGVDVQLNSGPVHLIQVLEDLLSGLAQIAVAVLVLHVADWHMNLELWGEIDAVIVLRDLVGNVNSANH